MNIVTLGNRLRKDTLKHFNMYQRQCNDLGSTIDLTYDQFLERNRQQLIADAVEGQKTIIAMKERFAELGLVDDKATKTYFITIRPDEARIDFDGFFALIQKLVARKCFQDFRLSFEQKGQTDDTLGVGFHTHIVATMTQRSKGEVLRDIQNSVKDCTDANCVDVKPAPRPTALVQNYLIDYKSDDEHKGITKEWDTKWRKQVGLLSLYENNVPPRIIEC